MKFIALFYLLISVTSVDAAMDEIPLQLTDDGHFSLKVAVNGKEGKFILDTGSTGSVVGMSKLEYFGIKIASSGINGVTAGDEKEGTTQTFPVSIQSMVIGSYELTLRNIYTNSIGQLGPDIDGIIGHDAIVELHALVDINKGRLLVPEDESETKEFFSGADSKYTAIPLLQTEIGFTLIKAKLEQHDVVLLVDSGAQQTVLDRSVLSGNLGFKLDDHPKAKSVSENGAETPMKVLMNKTIKIGSAEVNDDFLVTELGALRQAVGSKYGTVIGIVGNKELASINSIIDVANSTLYMRDK